MSGIPLPLLVVAAALLAVAAAAWSYGWREERVPGRAGPAALRALAVFFLLGGFFLPPLSGGPAAPSGPVVLLDASRSMALPAAPGAPARADSARALLRGWRPGRIVTFAVEPASVGLDSALARSPLGARSRLAPALEAAAASGADSVVVVGDGEWDDGPEAARTAARLGLGVREARIGRPVRRLGLASVGAPARAGVGDTVRVEVELVAAGREGGAGAAPAAADSARVEVRRLATEGTAPAGPAAPGSPAAASGSVGSVGSVGLPVPAPGRRARGVVAFVPVPLGPEEGTAAGGPGAARSAWRRYEVALPAGADPYGAADRRAFWLEVSEEPGGAVLVSTRPDWEPRFLLPVVGRAVLGSARGFLRVAPGRWLEMGARPAGVGPAAVERAVGAARLLVLQGDPADFPPWLSRAAGRHPRRLHLPGAAGEVPGTPARLSGPLTGEWYPAETGGPAPVARLLSGLRLEELPPLEVLWSVDGVEPGAGGAWSALAGRRNRRGEARPLLVAGEAAAGRWAVAAGRGYWGWALREGTPRRAYEGMFAGVAGWLVEDFVPRPVELEGGAEAGVPLRWRVSPGVTELRIAVLDSAGREVWEGRWDAPAGVVEGPRLPAGEASFRAEGRGPEGPFRRARPFTVRGDDGEWLPRAASEPLRSAGERRDRGRPPPRGRTPVWPFALAALLFCGEWVWRRRVGLR